MYRRDAGIHTLHCFQSAVPQSVSPHCTTHTYFTPHAMTQYILLQVFLDAIYYTMIQPWTVLSRFVSIRRAPAILASTQKTRVKMLMSFIKKISPFGIAPRFQPGTHLQRGKIVGFVEHAGCYMLIPEYRFVVGFCLEWMFAVWASFCPGSPHLNWLFA